MKKSINSIKTRISDTLYRVIYNEASAMETLIIGVGTAVAAFLIGYYILFPLLER